MGLKLTLSHDTPLDTTLTNQRTGLEHYKVETKTVRGDLTTIISRPCHFARDSLFADSDSSSVYSDTATVTDAHEEVAALQWRGAHRSARLRYDGLHVSMSEFMPNERSGAFSRSGPPMVWGPDGTRYRWNGAHLETTDEARTPVAVYHRPRGEEAAALEIMAAGEYMVDIIVISWVYGETLARKLHIVKTREKEAIDAAVDGGWMDRAMATSVMGASIMAPSGWMPMY
ncbi:hypothetical protein FIBSPDRAFT_961060 [Athelia psychrophila]|uniref:DUF6593 domain-containing protein n=1 Tax=Athelia psychrophila TaxID=1759441 RepID=A0A166BQL7_9AGAM|nr:hypothetical protein FIBSPDRAFT_961060 [Fibularhizoctonia sp. CBS 109695]